MSRDPANKASLGRIAARGGIILGAAGIVENGAQFLRALLLARILSPGDFGLMGMAFVVIYTGESLSQTGFYRALVQKRGDAASYLDTVWLVSAARGAALCALVALIAPWVGAFFLTPAVVPIVRVVSLMFLIQGFLNPAFFLLERDLAFFSYALPRTVGMLAEFAVSVGLALSLRNVWAMVWGFLAGKVILVAMSYAVRPFVPSFRMRWDQMREFYQYGRHIFRATAVDSVMGQADKAIVGRLLGADTLGLYSFASRLASLPAMGLYDVVYRVAFPIFSQVQEESQRLRAGFVRALGMMAAIAAPISAGLWAISADLVIVGFGEKWAGMIPAFAVLCLGGTFAALFYLIRAALGGIGRPDLAARGTYLLVAAFVVPIYPAIRWWGILGAAWCSTVATIAASIYLLVAGSRYVGCGFFEAARCVAAPLISAAVMAGSIVLAGAALARLPRWEILALEVLTGAILYPLLVALLDRRLGSGLLISLRSALRPA